MKTKLLLLFFFCTTLSAFAQKEYIRFGIGYDFGDAYGMKVEYGVRFFNWLETGLSLSVLNSLPLESDHMVLQINPGDQPLWIMGDKANYHMDGKLNASLMLNGSVDIVKLFAATSKHGVKVGVGLGVSYYHRLTNVFNSSSDAIIAMKHHMAFGFDYALTGMYEYAITPKIAVGVFGEFTHAPEVSLFGVNVKRSF